MSEVTCAGNEGNVLDCPFGGKPGEGSLPQGVHQTWVDYAQLDGSGCDATSNVGLCCDVSEFCPPRSQWSPDDRDYAHEGQMFMSMMRPEQMVPDMADNCKCDAGFFMVAPTVYAGRCQACPAGSCSPVGSRSISQCYCLEGFYKDANGDCSACPLNSCSKRRAMSTGECTCFEGFYMSDIGECVICPEGKTSLKGSTTKDECDMYCGLPHSSKAGDNAADVEKNAAVLAAADAAMKSALVPYIQAVNDEKTALSELATANVWAPPSPSAFAILRTQGHSTGYTDLDSRSTKWLDRQRVDCGAYPINQFRLDVHTEVRRFRKDIKRIRYNFKCAGNLAFSSPQDLATSQQNDGGGNVDHLDRLYLDCGSNKAMSMFRYALGKYQFRCVTPLHGQVTSCRTVYTGLASNDGGGQAVEYLDRQDVICSDNDFLQSFGLETHGGNMRYRYVCCKVTGGADQTFRSSNAALISANTREVNRCNSVIVQAQQVQATAKTLYEPEAAKRKTAADKLLPLLQISTQEGTHPVHIFPCVYPLGKIRASYVFSCTSKSICIYENVCMFAYMKYMRSMIGIC